MKRMLGIITGITVFIVSLLIFSALTGIILNFILSGNGVTGEGKFLSFVTVILFIASMFFLVYGCAKIAIRIARKVMEGSLNQKEKLTVGIAFIVGLTMLVTILISNNPASDLGRLSGKIFAVFLGLGFLYGIGWIAKSIGRISAFFADPLRRKMRDSFARILGIKS